LPGNYTLTLISSYGNSAGINSFGQAVGTACWSYCEPFLWTPTTANGTVGSLTDLGGLPMAGNPYSQGLGINDHGQVVGTTAQNYMFGLGQVFLWSPGSANTTTGSMVALTAAGNQVGTAVINNFGQVGGVLNGSPGIWTPAIPNGSTGTISSNGQFGGLTKMNGLGQAIMYSNGTQILLFTPAPANSPNGTLTTIPGLNSSANPVDINEKGWVLGYSCVVTSNGCQNHGFIWTPSAPNGNAGTTVEIPLPNNSFVSMTPTAINGRGDVVGTMATSSGSMVPFLYTGGVVYDLTSIGGVLSAARPSGINQAGQIVLNASGGVYLASPLTNVILPVTVTVTSVPAGMPFGLEGATYSTPYSFQWLPGSQHRVSFSSSVQNSGTRQGFTAWSDGNKDANRDLFVPAGPVTFTANYVSQYRLTVQANPAIGGFVTLSPPSPDGYYNAGTTVQMTAIANSAYQFTTFSGDLQASTPTQSIVISSPRTITANFSLVENPALDIQIANDISKTAQPGPTVTVALKLTNTGKGAANNVQLTSITARIMAPAPGTAAVNKSVPVIVGNLPAGATSGTIYVPVTLPDTARRTVLQIGGTLENVAHRQFTFSASVTILR